MVDDPKGERFSFLARVESLEDLIDNSLVGVIVRDVRGRLVDCNHVAEKTLGVERDQMVGRELEARGWDLVGEDGRVMLPEERPSTKVARTGRPELRRVTGVENSTQARRWMLTDTYATWREGEVDGTVSVFADITDVINSRRQLAITSAITHVMLAGLDEADSLQRVCEVLVNDGYLALAWVGIESQETPGLIDVSYAAGAVKYLYEGIVTSDESQPSGRGPTGTAMRTGQIQVANDLAHEPHFEVWRERAQTFHLGSAMAVPLRLVDRRAVLTIYDHARFVFDDELIARFAEVVREIEFGLAHVVTVSHIHDTLDRLTESELRFRLAFEGNMAPMLFTGLEDEPIAVNEAFCKLLGRSREEILERHWPPYTHPEDLEATEEAHRRLVSGQADQIRYVKRYVHRDGHTIVVEVSKHAARDESGRLLYAVLSARDVTEERLLTEQLSHQALHDPLTGLANRALFDDRLAQAIARSTRTGQLGAVLLLDLDDFKGVNDTHGHLVGDEVLRGAARRLELVTRASDSLSRFGGDEFFYLAEGLSSVAEGQQIAQRLLDVLSEPFDFEGLHFRQSASVGIALFDAEGGSPADFVQRADLALYEAKSRGKSRFAAFTPALHQAATSRFELTQELHLASRNGDLEMRFQPIVDLTSRHPVGFEALMRWEHPTRGEIAPSVFIPLAESGGLIMDMGEFALREATRAAAAWPTPGDGPAPYVSVNLSAAQFSDPRLVGAVSVALTDSGLDPARLVLEITESVMVQDAHEALRVIESLRALGVIVALDDFGTGYSSLSYVVRLNPHIIKIDRFFVNPSFESAHHSAMLDVVVSLGERLGLTMIAEGVETLDQLERLRAVGCDCAQGYLFSPAVTSEEAAAFIRRGAWPEPDVVP